MTPENQRGNYFKKGVLAGLPIVFGYFPVSMAFGLVARTVNVSFRDSCFFSLLVFAGASQFMALDLIRAGFAGGAIILATFLVNLRHVMMSAALSLRARGIKKTWLPVIAFGITDETFSVSSFTAEELTPSFLLGLHGVSYSAWVLGTVAGYLAGAFLPPSVSASFGIGLYAIFAALLAPEIRKSGAVLGLISIAGLIYLSIMHFKLLPDGWALIVTILAASVVGMGVLRDPPEKTSS